MLLHLPRMPEHGQPGVHNGPALAGHGALLVRDAIASSITTLPEQLRRSLTSDQGAELAQHAQLRIDIGLAIYFCDPHSPWQRAANENTNGLLRQYFPKGIDVSTHPDRARRRRGSAQQAPPQDPRLQDTSRSPQRASPPARTTRSGNYALKAGRYVALTFGHGLKTKRVETFSDRVCRHSRASECSGRRSSRTALSRRTVPASPLRGSDTHTTRSSRRHPQAPTLARAKRCCKDTLNSVSTSRSRSARPARDAGIAVSMGSKGDGFDNAVAESFFATLKTSSCTARLADAARARRRGVRVR
jgi:hypothetical protein